MSARGRAVRLGLVRGRTEFVQSMRSTQATATKGKATARVSSGTAVEPTKAAQHTATAAWQQFFPEPRGCL